VRNIPGVSRRTLRPKMISTLAGRPMSRLSAISVLEKRRQSGQVKARPSGRGDRALAARASSTEPSHPPCQAVVRHPPLSNH
jgi:hypothetical protein